MNDEKKWAGVIYVLTNLINGMKYVGKTERGYEARWDQHIALANGNSQCYIHRAIRKYGVENFSAEVVQHCHTSETLNKAEIWWIKKLRTFGPDGYNTTTGGDGVIGCKATKSVLKKMSAALILHWSDPDEHMRHVAAFNTPEAKSNASSSQKLRWKKMTPKEKAAFGKKLSKAQLKHYKIPGALEIMRLGQAKRFADPEKRAINAAAHRTEEFRALDSAKTKAKWADPKWRRAWIKRNTTPEARAKKSALGKVWHADPVHQIKFLAGTKSVECSKKHSESNLKYYADPTNHAKHLAAHRTEAFRKLKAENTRVFFAAMSPEERKAYWHKIHPNGIRAKV